MRQHSQKRIAAVFDCNIFLQAIGKGANHAYACLQLVEAGLIDLFISEEILSEIEDVLWRPELRKLFPMLTDAKVDELVGWIREVAQVIDPVEEVFSYPRDPKDEPYLNLAIKMDGVYLVSWDKDLLSLVEAKTKNSRDFLANYPQTVIVDPIKFLNVVRSKLSD